MKKSQLQELIRELFQQMLEEDDVGQQEKGLGNFGAGTFDSSPKYSPTAKGIGFWSAMYIPIVVAMAARQNVAAALSGGWMAIIAGVAAVSASFALIPVLARFGQGGQDDS